MASWAQRAQWHVKDAQSDVLSGHLDNTGSPASSLGVVVSAGICILVAVWVLPPRWRVAIGALSMLAACAVTSSAVAFATRHAVPPRTLIGAVVAGAFVIVAAVAVWSGRAPAASAVTRAARYDRVPAKDGETTHGPEAAADPWKQLDQGIDPTT